MVPSIDPIPSLNKPTFSWISTLDFYLAMKRNEILPSAATWMDLEGIMLSEISQTEEDNYVHCSLYEESKK